MAIGEARRTFMQSGPIRRLLARLIARPAQSTAPWWWETSTPHTAWTATSGVTGRHHPARQACQPAHMTTVKPSAPPTNQPGQATLRALSMAAPQSNTRTRTPGRQKACVRPLGVAHRRAVTATSCG